MPALKQIHGDFGDPFVHGGAWDDGNGDTIYAEGVELFCARHGETDDGSDACYNKPTRCQTLVYRWNHADWTDADASDWFDSPEQGLSALGMSRAEFNDLPPAGKWLAIMEVHGAIELDSYPEKLTRAQLAKLIGDDTL